MTPQRRAVFDALAGSGGHPTAAEIYARVQRTRPGLAYATVYNALHALVQWGVVLHLNFGGSASRYDARTERHDHALCVDCGALVDVAAAPPSPAALKAAAASGFSLQGHHTQFFGLCPSCSKGRADGG
jgi:Fur family peroxide stress response transcriptional regulator